MIKDRKEMNPVIEIDLSGPQGNAFVLLGYAKRLGKQIYGPEETEFILEEMKLSTYEMLILTFDKYFGEVVTLYRNGGKPTEWMET
tara:strand:+ start:14 stop:271 length:258 start_codon:yes stop_codon:yes gene_type:complete